MSNHGVGRRRGDGDGGDDGGELATGRATRVAARYGSGALSGAMQKTAGDGVAAAPTIDDVATAAVDGKDGGRAIDAGVTDRVGAHLGHDFSSVRVHDDPLAREATQAMGARAFAYGGDVFLGPGESDGDLGLMAHELTHVAQQGAAATRLPQRQVQVGASDSPAERQADAVSAEVTGGAHSGPLLVDEPPVQPGQMLKAQFVEQLRAAVTGAANQELGPVWSAMGCPIIESYFTRYSGQPAAAGEALLRRYGAGGARTAQDMIPLVVERVRTGVRAWRETGQTPDLPDGVAAAGVPPAGGPAAATMGAAQPMDAGTAGRMVDAMGGEVAGAQIHTGPEAARLAADHDALAVTVGPHVAFAAGAYQPGTLEGDALLAHELGHVAQQHGAEAPEGGALGDAGAALEDDADEAAVGAIARLWGGAKKVARKAGDTVKSGVTLARCNRNERPSPTGVHYERGAHPGSNPSPETWGFPGVTQDESADHDEVLADATAMNGGGVFVFYGHGNPRAVQSDDNRAVTAAELGTALGRDGNPPTVVVLGACSTSGMMSNAIGAGVGVVIGFDDNVNSVFLAGTLDKFMTDLNGGMTFSAAMVRANDQLARAPGMSMGQMVIQYSAGWNGGMTLEEARARGRAQAP